MWTDETIRAFDDLEGGSETAMKEYLVLLLIESRPLLNKSETHSQVT